MMFLTKIGAYRVNREDVTEGFTRGGILMLGKTESITDQCCAPEFFRRLSREIVFRPKAEVLANTLIHCNYAQQGNILVVGRRESITMCNPGCMLISLADFYAGSQENKHDVGENVGVPAHY